MLAQDDGTGLEESPEESEAFFKRTEYIHFICMLSPERPGTTDCIHLLEHTYYPVGTPANDHLWFRVMDWEDMVWGIVSIPFTDREYMDSAAQACGLRVSKSTMMMLTSTGASVFPIQDRAFTLVGSGHAPSSAQH